MMDRSMERRRTQESDFAATSLWIGLVTIGSVLGSFAFACAAPLAAIATIAALKMCRSEGLALVGAAWLANQLVGYLILDYPQTWDSFALGATLGVASALAFGAAWSTARIGFSGLVAIVVAFAAAFGVYEVALYGAALLLSSSLESFSADIIARILQVNAVALVALLLVHRSAEALQFSRRCRSGHPIASARATKELVLRP